MRAGFGGFEFVQVQSAVRSQVFPGDFRVRNASGGISPLRAKSKDDKTKPSWMRVQERSATKPRSDPTDEGNGESEGGIKG
jgi:hypothetical protein